MLLCWTVDRNSLKCYRTWQLVAWRGPYFIKKNTTLFKKWDNGQWKRHTKWAKPDPWQWEVFPHHFQGISWSTHFSTLWVPWILSWVKGRGGWSVWTKHTVIPQLSVHAFIHCIWIAVPTSVPTEILFHSLYTKHKNRPNKPFNIWQLNPLELKMAVCICATVRS